jgi:hypothetical protein
MPSQAERCYPSSLISFKATHPKSRYQGKGHSSALAQEVILSTTNRHSLRMLANLFLVCVLCASLLMGSPTTCGTIPSKPDANLLASCTPGHSCCPFYQKTWMAPTCDEVCNASTAVASTIACASHCSTQSACPCGVPVTNSCSCLFISTCFHTR